MPEEFEPLSPVEVRVLGCLAEKKALTPDVYPLTLGAVVIAANQKTGRDPVMTLDQAEVRRALASLQQKSLVRQAFASRVDRYEHLLAQRFSLTQSQVGLLALLMLRGPQTARELFARSERIASFRSLEEALSALDLMSSRKPPLVQLMERAPGQREERYVHLLGGPAEHHPARPAVTASAAGAPDLEARLQALEEEVARLGEQLRRLTGQA